jgi:type II secretory pathway pseudopilin PulG
MLKKLPWTEIVVVTLALAAGVGIYWYAHRDQAQLEESKQRGAAIVQGLQAYRDRHGTYPEHLAELEPSYVARVEPPTWGLERWRYRRFTGTGSDTTDAVYFQLSVAQNESGYPVLYYDYTARRWVLNN